MASSKAKSIRSYNEEDLLQNKLSPMERSASWRVHIPPTQSRLPSRSVSPKKESTSSFIPLPRTPATPAVAAWTRSKVSWKGERLHDPYPALFKGSSFGNFRMRSKTLVSNSTNSTTADSTLISPLPRKLAFTTTLAFTAVEPPLVTPTFATAINMSSGVKDGTLMTIWCEKQIGMENGYAMSPMADLFRHFLKEQEEMPSRSMQVKILAGKLSLELSDIHDLGGWSRVRVNPAGFRVGSARVRVRVPILVDPKPFGYTAGLGTSNLLWNLTHFRAVGHHYQLSKVLNLPGRLRQA
ncbi:hypothetical protein C8J57DRAFT_1248044 [Mycena rebaudengoi]|nr:hypothetical protein C8J57DRAFT_1248044 [Mycena rebaudengoi]